jgi:Uma2 family endonuclease
LDEVSAVATRKLGPADHGRRMTREDFDPIPGEHGYRFELIRGRVEVYPRPEDVHGWVLGWLLRHLSLYTVDHPESVNQIFMQGRVVVPDPEGATNPEPDLLAYRNFPRDVPIDKFRWDDVYPILVAEVVQRSNPEKDYERNVELYELVPSIREYWIADPREDAARPYLRVYRRRGQRWQKPIDVTSDPYTTRLLPGFELPMDTRSQIGGWKRP